jgi:integrase
LRPLLTKLAESRKGEAFLFAGVGTSAEGRRGLFTRRITKRIHALGVNDGRTLAPYSLRHQFRTNLSRAGVSAEIADRLMGHAAKGIGLRTYTHGADVGQLAAAIEKLDASPVVALIERINAEMMR